MFINLKQKLKQQVRSIAMQIQRILGIDVLQQEIDSLRGSLFFLDAMRSYNLPADTKYMFMLPFYSKPSTGIAFSARYNTFRNVKDFLFLLCPAESKNLELVRIGGKGDGGYVMLSPPPY